MVVPSVFELNSIKDQLSLLAALVSHINFEELTTEDMDENLERMLSKMDKATKNLQEKYENLKSLLNNW